MVYSTFLPIKRFAAIVLIVVTVCFFLLWFPLPQQRDAFAGGLIPGPAGDGDKKNKNAEAVQSLTVPSDYSFVPPENEYCETRFSTKFLDILKNSTDQYCSEESRSRLKCFHITTDPKGRIDSLCIGHGAVVDVEAKRFSLDCQLREISPEEKAAGAVSFAHFPKYWYDTGPRYIFDNFVKLDASESLQGTSSTPADGNRTFALLIKREGHQNTWHSLMEIMTMTLTFDMLRMTPDPLRLGQAYYSYPEDMANTQVVILDDAIDGPYYDLWRLFSDKPLLRLPEYIAQSASSPALLDNIIVPMAGAANPQWQNDWTVEPCSSGQLLQTFSRRVTKFYGFQEDQTVPAGDADITVTFIDRKHRRLIDQESHLDSLRQKFNQHVTIQSIDLAAVSFKEQLQIIRNTDVLVGVHGAGLTHELFLRKESAVVEILPPDLDHKGFRNMANMLGHDYFSVHGGDSPRQKKRKEKTEEEFAGESALRRRHRIGRTAATRQEEDDHGLTKRDWHDKDVSLNDAKFIDVVSAAIQSMYNKGLRNYDIS